MTPVPRNSDLPEDWMSAFLDGELPESLRTSAESQLETNSADRETLSALQDLDRRLFAVIHGPQFDQAGFETALDAAREQNSRPVQSTTLHHVSPARESGAGHGRSRLPVILTLSLLAVAGLALVLRPADDSGIVHRGDETSAVVEVSLGRVELRCTGDDEWLSPDAAADRHLTKGCHLRTGDDGLCEVRLSSGSIVRMKQQSEILILSGRELQLVAGSVWCRAAGAAALTMVVPVTDPVAMLDPRSEAALSAFRCPTESRTQWQVTRQGTTCQSVSDEDVQLATATELSCTVQPGERMLMDSLPEPSGTGDPLLDTGWQLPLLVTRPPLDPELQSVLQRLLSQVGRTKLAGLYDQQIRGLGPAGTLPLIAFVRSSDPDADRDLRRRAMEIIADLAPSSAVSDLRILAQDSDPYVRDLASRALIRFC